MGFLTGVIVAITEWLLSKLFALVGKEYGQWKADRQIDQKVDQDKKAIEGANTDEERAKAGADSAHNTFG